MLLSIWLLSYFLKYVTMIEMKRTSRKNKRISSSQFDWMPVDSRLFLPLFSFGKVQGIARWFLQLEILFAVLVVAGTIYLAVAKMML